MPDDESVAAGGPVQADLGRPGCSVQQVCASGSYCAVDGNFYPNSQSQQDYSDSTSASTGSFGTVGSGVTSPNPIPGELAPELGIGRVMEGRWTHSGVTPGPEMGPYGNSLS